MAGSVIANLKIMLSATWEKLRSDFGKAKKAAQGFTSQIKGGFNAAMGSIGSLGGVAGSAIGQITSLGSALAALGPIAAAVAVAVGVLVGAFSFASWGTKLAAEAETAQVAFETVLGSAKDASAVMSQISEFASSTPFQKDELTEAGKKLAAFSFQAGDIVPTLRMIGDVSTLIGAPIGEMAELFGKAKVQGRLFMEDINQFQGRGVPVLQALADQVGVTALEMREMVSDGKVGFNELYRAFDSMTGEAGKFHGGMAKASETVNGLWSTLKDLVAEVAKDWGTMLLPVVKETLKYLVEFLKWAREIRHWQMDLLGFAVGNSQEEQALSREDFSKPTEGLKETANQAKKAKEHLIDLQQMIREIRGESQSGKSTIAAIDARTTAGFSQINAAKREAIFQERLPAELAKRVLDKMDEQLAELRKNKVEVYRHRS